MPAFDQSCLKANTFLKEIRNGIHFGPNASANQFHLSIGQHSARCNGLADNAEKIAATVSPGGQLAGTMIFDTGVANAFYPSFFNHLAILFERFTRWH
jgi:hypothetical protein